MRHFKLSAMGLAALLLVAAASPALAQAVAPAPSVEGASATAGPLTAWVDSVDSFFDIGSKVNVNDVPDPDTIFDQGDYSAFAFASPSFNTSAIVYSDSSDNGTPDVVSQSLSLTIADAIARNSTGTASDLIFQSLLRQSSAATTAAVLNAMVAASGCHEPLVGALQGALAASREVDGEVIFALAFRNLPASIGDLADCLALVENA